MRLLFLLLFSIALTPALARAQEARERRNAVTLELGGSGVTYSLNYERFGGNDLSLRVGFGYISIKGAYDDFGNAWFDLSLLTIPVTASYLGLGSGSHRLELGGGVVIATIPEDGSSDWMKALGSASGVAGTAIVGYRYLRPQGGFTFRAAFTPLFGEGGFQPWTGVALGYCF